ncbi:MAG TPA: phosphoribosylamine--glycine ligase [Gemmatimonadaceae bacterium]
MKVLLVGGGGREHALAWALHRDDPTLEIVAAPGNPGIAELARCVPVKGTDLPALLALAESERVDLTIVGPEAPLAEGIVDRFRERGLPIFGPTRAAAAIETSKRFAKQLMLDARVPTAHATFHTEPASAKAAASALGAPVVVKASGLAAGKGVSVCASIEEAERAIDAMLTEHAFGAAGTEVLVEEFMEGEELSLFALTDGRRAATLVAAQDHKRLLEGDRGPNTGGMGAYAPVSLRSGALAADALADEARRTIIEPTLDALAAHGTPFTGLLYAGLMVTRDGLRVVEFNCRFGDPETQVVLPLTASPLLPLLLEIGGGGTLSLEGEIDAEGAGVTTVLAAAGYPGATRGGDEIRIPERLPSGVRVFHAGTARDASGRLVTAGGRVLAVTAVADDIESAHAASVAAAEAIEFSGKQFRRDIGWRELARRARAS